MGKMEKELAKIAKKKKRKMILTGSVFALPSQLSVLLSVSAIPPTINLSLSTGYKLQEGCHAR